MSPSKDSPSPAPTKIAIKGFSLSSKSSSSTKPGAKPPPSSLGKRSRDGFARHDDSGSEDESSSRQNGRGKVEVVSGFEDGGAVSARNGSKGTERIGELVIPKLANRDWKGDGRSRQRGLNGIQRAMVDGRGKNLLPPEVQAEMAARQREKDGRGDGKEEGVDVVNSKEGEIEWGLSVRKRVKTDEVESTTDTKMEEKVGAEKLGEKPKTADEEALAALLGQNTTRTGPELVISSSTNNTTNPISETDAYKLAIASAPEASTLEDYERVPVEEFGAALLRGMGWKGETHGKVKDVKRRQNLLGLGAKELKEAEELGAWVMKSDVKRLNPGAGGSGRGERKPKASEYRREEEKRRERREERGGGSYRRERERDERNYRDQDRRDRR